MHISPTVHYSAGHSYVQNQYTLILELMNCCIEIRFLPGRISSLTLLVLMYVSGHVSVQVLVEAHAVEQ